MPGKSIQRFPFLINSAHPHAKFYHRIEVPSGTVLIKEGEIAKKAFLIEKWIRKSMD